MKTHPKNQVRVKGLQLHPEQTSPNTNPTPQRVFDVHVPYSPIMTEYFVLKAESLDDTKQKLAVLCPERVEDWQKFLAGLFDSGAQPGNWAEAVCQPANPTYPAWFEVMMIVVHHFTVSVPIHAETQAEAERYIPMVTQDRLASVTDSERWKLRHADISVPWVRLAGIEAAQLRESGEDSNAD